MRRRIATVIALAILAVSPAAARAEGSPAIELAAHAPAEVLYGSKAAVTLTASNPSGQPYGYNLSFRAVLPAGISFVAGSGHYSGSASALEPLSIANEPEAGQTTLIWTNVGDLSPGAHGSLSFEVAHSTSKFTVGSSYTITGGAYLNTQPRFVPKFSAAGIPEGPSSSSFTGSATASATTKLSAIEITQSEPSPEGEILRGVHDHQTVYTLEVKNTTVSSTQAVTVDDWLPAGLEFVGCGGAGVDHTTDAPTNPGSSEEYPGSGAINVAALSGCLAPALVETVETDPDGAGPDPTAVYTHVRWTLGTLAPGESRTIEFRAAVPLRQNTLTWTGTEPTPESGHQAVNLDNNSGSETRDGETLDNYAKAGGSYEGKLPVSSSEHLTRVAKDLTTEKSASSGVLAEGQVTLWTIHIHSSEYRYNTALTVTDTLPNGLCPLDETNLTASAECEPTGKAEDVPSFPYTSAVEEANGSWSLVWNETTDPQLANLEQNTTRTIVFATRTRTHYQSGHAPASPILANDAISNHVVVAGTTNVVCDGDGDCAGGSKTPIDHERPLSEPISDDSSFAQTGTGPTIAKEVAESGTECLADKYTSSVPVYHPGDLVCWRLNASFPFALDTQGLTITDFLSPNGLFDAAFNGGTGEAATANDTLPGTTFNHAEAGTTEPGGVLSWTLPEAGHVQSKGQVFERVYATTAELPTGAVPGELQGNLMKFASKNTGGESFPLRAEASFALQFPKLALSKHVVELDGKAITPTGSATVKGGDEAKFALTVSNSGKLAAGGIEVWDELPNGLTCGDIKSISRKGVCLGGKISWGEVGLGEEEVTVPAEGHSELTFVVAVPATIGPHTTLTDHAGVREYDSPTNTGEKFHYVPKENIDPTLDAHANASAANASASLSTNNVILEKTHSSALVEAGNSAAQATIGEEVTFKVSATVPAGTTLAGVAHMTDPGLPSARFVYEAGSAEVHVNGAAAAGFTVEQAGGTPIVLFPEDYAAPTSGNEVVELTFRVHVANVEANKRATSIPNTAKLTWTDPLEGAQTREATDSVPVVEPSISLAETNDSGGPVHGGQLVEYKLTLDNAAGASTAFEDKVVDAVAGGVTPSNAKGEPLKNGESTADGGVWSEKTRTITWTLASLTGGAEHTFTYFATVDEHPVSGTELTDSALATTWSLPAESARARNPANAPGTTNTGYEAPASNQLEVAGPTLTKASDSPQGTIGHRVTYTLTVTLPAHVTTFDTTVIDTLPDALDFDEFLSATCVSGCPPEAAPVVQTYKPAITSASTTLAWSLGDLPETMTPRTEQLVYVASVRSTHRNGGAAIAAGTVIANSAALYNDTTNKLGFEEATIPPAGSFDKHTATVSAETTVVEPEVALVKEASVGGGAYSASPFSIGDGQTVSYRLRVTNNGSGPAFDVTVHDTPPSGLTEISETTNKALVTKSWKSAEPEIRWKLDGPIAPKETVELGYTAKLAPVGGVKQGQLLTNAAAAPSYFGVSEEERQLGRKNFNGEAIVYREYKGPSASVTGTVTLPSISIEKTTAAAGFPTSANAEVGQPFGWRVVVKNTSSVPAKALTVEDVLPPNWEYVGGSASFSVGGALAPTVSGSQSTGLNLKWSTAIELAPGQATTLTYQAKAIAAAASDPGTGSEHPSVNTAKANVDDAAGNGEDAEGPFAAGPAHAQAILLIPGLEITKTPVRSSVAAGEGDEYEITVRNGGSGTARELVLIDTLPAGMTYHAGSATASPSSGFSETSATGSTVKWAISSLAVAHSVVITMPVGTEAGLLPGTELENSVAVHSVEQPTPVSANGTITTTASADVSASKSAVGTSVATPGADITYRLGAANHGPSQAANVKLTDTLPPSLSYVSGPAGCSASAATVTCEAGDVEPGAEASFEIVVRLASADIEPVENSVLASSETPDPDESNNSAMATLPVAPSADLSLVKTALAQQVLDRGQATYSLLASNAGPSDATGATVTDELPEGLTYLGASGASCSDSGQLVTCSLGTLISGTQRTILLTVATTRPGSFLNRASLSSETEDPVPANNDSEASITVVPAADLSIVKTASPEVVAVPGQVTYTLQLANAGPDPAQAVLVSDTLPAGETLVGSEAGCAASGQLVTCDVGELAVGASRAIVLQVAVAVSLAEQTVANTASVSSATADPDPSNNSSTVSLRAGPAPKITAPAPPRPEVTLRKLVRQRRVLPGGLLDYRLVVRDTGPGSAEGLRTCDLLPRQTTVVKRGGGHLAGGRICFTLTALAAGASHTYTIVLRANSNATGHIHNRATVTGANFAEASAHTSTPVNTSGSRPLRVTGVTG